MIDDPTWCSDPTVEGCSIGAREASTMPAEERRALVLKRARERAQVVLAQPEERAPERQRRVGMVVVASLALHAAGFGLLTWFGDGVERRASRRGQEQFDQERVLVPIDVPERSPEPELAAQPEPQPAEPMPRPRPHRHAARSQESTTTEPSEPTSYALQGFELSSESAQPAGAGPGEAWGHADEGGGSGKGHEHGHAGALNDAPDVQAKPRGSVVEPDYPAELERRGIEGDVVVLVWLDEHGHVIKAEVVESSGYEAFDHNAEMAAQRQAWTPAMRAGEPVASKRRYRIRFRLPER
jgi:TonB family protein